MSQNEEIDVKVKIVQLEKSDRKPKWQTKENFPSKNQSLSKTFNLLPDSWINLVVLLSLRGREKEPSIRSFNSTLFFNFFSLSVVKWWIISRYYWSILVEFQLNHKLPIDPPAISKAFFSSTKFFSIESFSLPAISFFSVVIILNSFVYSIFFRCCWCCCVGREFCLLFEDFFWYWTKLLQLNLFKNNVYWHQIGSKTFVCRTWI